MHMKQQAVVAADVAGLDAREATNGCCSCCSRVGC